MRDESQNALLKTLEEPPDFAHLILLSSEPGGAARDGLLALPAGRVRAAARRGDRGGARGRRPRRGGRGGRAARRRRPRARPLPARRRAAAALRAEARACAAAALTPSSGGALEAAADGGRGGRRGGRGGGPRGARGGEAGRRQALRPGNLRGGEARRAPPPHRDARPRPGALRGWFRDLAAVAAGAEEVAFNRDRLAAAARRRRAASTRPRARRAAELVQDTRRRLDLNVSEELALEALFFRLEDGSLVLALPPPLPLRRADLLASPARSPAPGPDA